MRRFEIIRNPNDCGNLYYRKQIEFEPGVTVLVGCNGCGKTSLIRQIKRLLNDEDIPNVSYDNLSDGGANARSRAGFYGDFTFLGTSLCSSEGENIALNLGNVAHAMGSLIAKNPNSNEYWFLFDGIDSGFSIDNVLDLKEGLFNSVIKHNPGKDIYIIVSANAFAMCEGEKCFDTYLGKYVDIKTYDAYKDFVMKSRKRKDKREEKLSKKRSARK